MKQRIQEHRRIFEPRNEEYERMIKNLFGDNEFLANIFRYASRKCDLTKKEGQAKELLEGYEDAIGLSQQTKPNNIEW